MNQQRQQDTQWVFTLFGTAVGAGILFLPINAGIGGIWPLLLMTVLIWPMTFLSHRGLNRFCLSSASSDPNTDITHTVVEHFGKHAGKLITFGYVASIYPILIIYGIGITNTVNSLLVNQIGVEAPNRGALSFVLVALLVGVMECGQKTVLKVTNAIVYPLIAILLGTSLYLIPQWNTAQFQQPFDVLDFVETVFLTIPVLVFSFSFAPAVSTFASYYREQKGDNAQQYTNGLLKKATWLLVGFTMFFVYSCVLTLSPEQLMEAKEANISVMSFLAMNSETTTFGWLAQFIAIVAISSSFFGHYMGCYEGFRGLMINRALREGHPKNLRWVERGIVAFIFLSVWLIAYADVSVMGMIEAIAAPILALILFILPVYAVSRVPSMKQYRSGLNVFTAVMGIIAIVGFVVAQLM